MICICSLGVVSIAQLDRHLQNESQIAMDRSIVMRDSQGLECVADACVGALFFGIHGFSLGKGESNSSCSDPVQGRSFLLSLLIAEVWVLASSAMAFRRASLAT